MFNHKIVNADVLIIGSGCAGLGAALEIAKQGQNVVVVEKGSKSGLNGASIMAIQLVSAALGIWEPDSPNKHAEDTLACGRGLSNPKLVTRMTERAPERMLEFARWGMKFTERDGKFDQIASPGHSARRGLHVDFKYGAGRSMMQALMNQLKPFPNFKVINHTYIRELIKTDNKVSGAIGFDISNGEIIVFKAKVVVLASGGGMESYCRNSGSRYLTGDGYRLAYFAGAPLQDMEFVQFVPKGTLYPSFPGLFLNILEPMGYRTGGRLTNGLGEEFLLKYISAKTNATRDIISYAIVKEVQEGRGTLHGGVYFEPGAEVGAKGLIEAYGQQFLDQFLQFGVDISSEKVEVYPIAHYFMGGVVIDEDGRTPVEGLFATGEVTGGIHGANRLAGNSLTDVMVYGQVVGISAGEEAKRRSQLSGDAEKALSKMQEEISHRLKVKREPELSVTVLRERLQNQMLSHVGPIRHGVNLENALRDIVEIEESLLPLVGLSEKNPIYNQELLDFFDLESMLTTAKLTVQAALLRKESRGAHRREDYPFESPEWTRNIILKHKPGQFLPHIMSE